MQGFRKRIQHAPLVLRQGIFPQEGVELRLLPLVRLFERRSISAGEQQTQKILKAVRQRVYKVRRTVHRADGKDHIAEAADEAVVNAVHACPAKNFRAHRRTEIRFRVLAPLNAERRKVKAKAQEGLIGLIHAHALHLFESLRPV